MRQPASYHGGLGLSLLGQRVRPAPPPRRGGPLLHEPIIYISPSTTRATSSLPPQPPTNKHHVNCFNPPDNKCSRPELRLKVNTIGEDIDNFLAVGKQLMRIREADTVQQLQRLLHGANLCLGNTAAATAKPKPSAKHDADDVRDAAVADFYENYFLVHHTTLRNAIAKLVDSDAVT